MSNADHTLGWLNAQLQYWLGWDAPTQGQVVEPRKGEEWGGEGRLFCRVGASRAAADGGEQSTFCRDRKAVLLS